MQIHRGILNFRGKEDILFMMNFAAIDFETATCRQEFCLQRSGGRGKGWQIV
jgi:hypothetical protein